MTGGCARSWWFEVVCVWLGGWIKSEYSERCDEVDEVLTKSWREKENEKIWLKRSEWVALRRLRRHYLFVQNLNKCSMRFNKISRSKNSLRGRAVVLNRSADRFIWITDQSIPDLITLLESIDDHCGQNRLLLFQRIGWIECTSWFI